MTVYTMSEARAALASLLDEVERGEEVTITRHGRPAARLVSPGRPNPRTADIMHRVDAVMVALELARSRGGPLPPPNDEGPTADELVARLRADRDAS